MKRFGSELIFISRIFGNGKQIEQEISKHKNQEFI